MSENEFDAFEDPDPAKPHFMFKGKKLQAKITQFKIGKLKPKSLLIVYPAKNGIQKIKKFTGFEFSDVEEGFSFDDSAVGKKCSGLAIWGEGMV